MALRFGFFFQILYDTIGWIAVILHGKLVFFQQRQDEKVTNGSNKGNHLIQVLLSILYVSLKCYYDQIYNFFSAYIFRKYK